MAYFQLVIDRPYYKNRFNHFQYILGSQIVYIDGIVVTMLYATIAIIAYSIVTAIPSM